LCPTEPSVKAKSQVYLYAKWGHISLKCSIAKIDRQNRKFAQILIIKRTGFVHQELKDIVKMTLTRVSDCYSNRDILSSRVTIFINVTRVESESS